MHLQSLPTHPGEPPLELPTVDDDAPPDHKPPPPPPGAPHALTVVRPDGGPLRLAWGDSDTLVADAVDAHGALESEAPAGRVLLGATRVPDAFRVTGCASLAPRYRSVRYGGSFPRREQDGLQLRLELPCGLDRALEGEVSPFVLTTPWSNVRGVHALVRHEREVPLVTMLVPTVVLGVPGAYVLVSALAAHPSDPVGDVVGGVLLGLAALIDLALLPSVVAPDTDEPLPLPAH